MVGFLDILFIDFYKQQHFNIAYLLQQFSGGETTSGLAQVRYIYRTIN